MGKGEDRDRRLERGIAAVAYVTGAAVAVRDATIGGAE
jgi:hypothetical protein